MRLRNLCFILLMIMPGIALAAKPEIDFNRDIRPILSDNCFHCHGPDNNKREADLRLDLEESAFADLGGHKAIVPGNVNQSELYQRIRSKDNDLVMPPADSGKSLTQEEIDLIRKWIEQGANWQEHWSFLTPVKIPPPKIKPTDDARAEDARNEIDQFIIRRLESEGLSLSPKADRRTLLRRVTFDLTGLPPTRQEIKAFLDDTSPDAYEKVVDRLIASQAYGEHMARYWLDVARYGDTHGLHLDNYREMWPYRDWVIKAFNQNLPIDQFIIKQLAGDLLPNATTDDIVATGFNRCHVTTNEGGTIAEEFYVRNVVDRVETTSTAFMGLTLGCAVCHEHKYDPITQTEFYQLFAFFNNIDGSPMDGNVKDHPPFIYVPTEEQKQKWDAIKQRFTKTNQQIQQRTKSVEPVMKEWLNWQKSLLVAKMQPVIVGSEPKDLTIHYPLDENAGLKAANALDAKKPGKIAEQANWVPGKLANAYKFTSKGSAIDLGNQGGFKKTTPFAISLWIKTPGNVNGAVVAKMDANNRMRGYELRVNRRKLTANFSRSYPDLVIQVTTRSNVLKPNQWHHVCLNYEGTGKASGVSLHVDGMRQLVKVEHDSLGNYDFANGSNLKLGIRDDREPFTNGMIDDLKIYSRKLTQAEIGWTALHDVIPTILNTPQDKRTNEQKTRLRNYYLTQYDEQYLKLTEQLERTKQEEISLKDQMATTLVFKERKNAREAFFLERGAYDQKRNKVPRKTPAVLPAMDEDLPRNRLGFAQWLVSPKHPLTSRVMVNRYWQQVFGTGLVKTSDDFGSQGESPSHPELLDWLAVDFQENGWNLKRLMKQFVMSATYRQSSIVTPEQLAKDPNNRLLARSGRYRLDAEMLRDQALALSGLLVNKIGGPSVKPPQPDGLWFAVGYSGSNTVRYKQDTGPDNVYRRTIYTFIKRTAPPPQMSTFDAPNREACTVSRERTNTPLQALLLMNDPQYVEAARFFAERILIEGGSTDQKKINFAFELATARLPSAAEQSALLTALADFKTNYDQDAEAAKKLIDIGETKPAGELNPTQLAAWTMIANLILNLDEVITKG